MILAVTFAGWRWLDLQRSDQIQTLIDREIGFAGDLLVRDLQSRYAAASHFAHLWERGTPPDGAQFRADALEQMDSAPGLRAIGYADANLVLQQVVPAGFRDMAGRSILISDARRTALRQAQQSRETVISDPVDLMDGSGLGFLMYVPLYQGETFEGVLLVVFQVEYWLQHVFGSAGQSSILPGFALDVTMNGTPLFRSAGFDAERDAHATQVSARWQDVTWEIAARPRARHYTDHWHWAPESLAAVVLLVLSTLAALLSLVRRARLAEARAHSAALELMDMNATLRNEADVRRRAEAEAQSAREATARFLATMSHEIRTPLNAIIGMFQLINAAGDLPDRQRKQAAMGVEAARRLHRDLSNVLDVSRLDAGALRVRVEDTALAPLTQSWVTALEAFVKRSDKPISCVVEIDSALPELASVDAAALTQVVNNLMDNAVKFTDAGSVTLSVTGDVDALRITVADTGMGIDPTRRDTVFQRFYQVDDGMERRFSGTGLGLSITRDLVELMQGCIDTRPNTPCGTVFEVTLPGTLTHIIPVPAALASDADGAIRL